MFGNKLDLIILIDQCVDAELVNTQALERADRNDQITSDELRRPVRPVARRLHSEDLEPQAREGPRRRSKI